MSAPMNKPAVNMLCSLKRFLPMYSCIQIRNYARRIERTSVMFDVQTTPEHRLKDPRIVNKIENYTSTITNKNVVRKNKSDQGDKFILPDDVKFTQLNEGDKRLGPVLMSAKSRKNRERNDIILLEGRRLVVDAIEAGAQIKSIYFSKAEYLKDVPLQLVRADLYKVKPVHMKLWSDVTAPQGIIALAKMPKPGELDHYKDDEHHSLPLTLICDQMRDPGNMGTLLRTAAAVGCRRVLLTKGCVDIWEPKVLRAGAGSHFRLRMLNNLGWEIIGNYLTSNTQIFLADSNVRMEEGMEGNVDIMKRLSPNVSDKHIEIDTETGEAVEHDNSFLQNETVDLFSRAPINTCVYSDINFKDKDVTLVVGGETEGLSASARKMAFERNGDLIHIPMMNGVNSLNSAMAASIILFEIKRQLCIDQ